MSLFPKFDFSSFERKLFFKSRSKALCELRGGSNGNIIDFAKYLNLLNEDEKTELEERAAIIEYDGGLTREKAEKNTFNNLIYLRKCQK